VSHVRALGDSVHQLQDPEGAPVDPGGCVGQGGQDH